MTPIQQLMLGVGAKKKTYMDDVFSTYVYAGTGSNRSINNEIDLSGEGGMTWIKQRTGTADHVLNDTVRGAGNRLRTNVTAANASSTAYLSAFNNNGFSLGTDADVNGSGSDYSSWSFKRAKGFFDCVVWTGDGSANRQISHGLSSIPGLIIIKCSSNASTDWIVWNRDFAATEFVKLNSFATKATDDEKFGGSSSVLPTATTFTIGNSNDVNGSGRSYVAYVYGGGESTAATANSTVFTGSIYLQWQTSSSDFEFGTSDFTCEAWVKPTATNTNLNCILSCGLPFQWYWKENSFKFYANDGGGVSGSNYFVNHLDSGANYPRGQWYHVAITRSGSTFRLFVNGLLTDTATSSTAFGGLAGTYPSIGMYNSTSDGFAGSVSNLRIVKGTALYTSSFRPPTEPLTNITNTKLLFCNSSSNPRDYTVSPSTITSSGGVNASSDSPFDDPSGFVFGENGEGIIKCGTFVGNGNADGPELNLGWEPQFIITKNIDRQDHWMMFDSMRGLSSYGNNTGDATLYPYVATAESDWQHLDLTPTGFKIKSSNADINGDGEVTLYIAIRRPDGYVGKPAEVGTDVFAMDTGNSNSTVPCFDSGFPVDFALRINPTATWNSEPSKWRAMARLMQGKYLMTHASDTESSNSYYPLFDSNVGISKGADSSFQSWMWKRHAGFDVVTDTSAEWVSHNLGRAPEMVIIKHRTVAENWFVWHKDLNGGGSNSIGYWMYLNGSAAQSNAGNVCPIGNTLPTATHFQSDTDSAVRHANCIAFLFASVDGISKCGVYDGTGEMGPAQTITLGFQPRFIMIKRIDGTLHWWVLDTTRGWGSGNDKHILLSAVGPQSTTTDSGAPTSTGCTVNRYLNKENETYIYYAHA